MKTLIFLVMMGALTVATRAQAYTLFLQYCDYTWAAEHNKSVYIGTYKSSRGLTFTMTFDNYCPTIINR